MQSLMPKKKGEGDTYIGFWINKEDLNKLDKLVEYFREKESWARVNRSAVIRKLISDAYSTLIAHNYQSDSKVYKPQEQ
jgi:hypothetical protein